MTLRPRIVIILTTRLPAIPYPIIAHLTILLLVILSMLLPGVLLMILPAIRTISASLLTRSRRRIVPSFSRIRGRIRIAPIIARSHLAAPINIHAVLIMIRDNVLARAGSDRTRCFGPCMLSSGVVSSRAVTSFPCFFIRCNVSSCQFLTLLSKLFNIRDVLFLLRRLRRNLRLFLRLFPFSCFSKLHKRLHPLFLRLSFCSFHC